MKARTLDGQVLAKHLLSRRAPCRAEESQRRKGELRVVSGTASNRIDHCRLTHVLMHPFSVAGSPCSDKPKHDSTETVQSVIRFLKTSSLLSNELQ